MNAKQPVPEDKAFAFWRYDLFPYCLGGEVSEILDDGRVYVPKYQGHFRPCYLTSLEEGKELLKKLMDLRELQRQTQETVKKGFEAQVKEFLPFKMK